MLKGLILIGIINNFIFKRKRETLIIGIISLYYIIGGILGYNLNNSEIQYREEIKGNTIGIDGISIIMIIVIYIIEPIIIILIPKEGEKELLKIIRNVRIIVTIVYITLDIIIYYITYEMVLIPMIILIKKYGSKYKYYKSRIEITMKLIIYTIIGSIGIIGGIIIIWRKLGTTSNEIIKYNEYISIEIRYIIWSIIIIGLIIKIPSIPFHIWLPSVHSEAPTIGSIILAGIIIKIGAYGLIRYTIIPGGTIGIKIIEIIGNITIIYSTIIIIKTIKDMKKIIAYTSIIHMNMIYYGIYSNIEEGIIGGIIIMYTHGIIATSLFIIVGIIYRRYHTRIIIYYKGLERIYPLYTILFFLNTLGNISLPITIGFISEYLILVSIIRKHTFLPLSLIITLTFLTITMIWYNKEITEGKKKLRKKEIKEENIILIILTIMIYGLIIIPTDIIDYIIINSLELKM